MYARKQAQVATLKKKNLDCQEVRFDYGDSEGMQVMAGNVAGNDSLFFFLTREKGYI